MTISSQNRVAGPYAGTGAVSTFPFGFKVFATSDLQVLRTDSLGNDVTLTLDADFTVLLNADQEAAPGGTVTLIAGALASDYSLTITSSVPYLQPIDITNQGGFYPRVIMAALDRLTILCQQLFQAVSRSLQVSVTLPDGVQTKLPSPSASTVLGWDEDALRLKNYPLAGAGVADASVVSAADASAGLPRWSTVQEFINYLKGSSGSTAVGFSLTDVGAAARTAMDKLGDLVNVRDFGAKGDYYLSDGSVNPNATDDTAAIQNAITATGGRVTFGSRGAFWITGPIGLPYQSVTGSSWMQLRGFGATLVVDSAEAIFTSQTSLATPESTSNLYTAKIRVEGLNFVGVGASSVVFNGDRLYNLHIVGNNFTAVSKVIYSYREKAGYADGYIQSVKMVGNEFASCGKIIDAKRGFNIAIRGNNCESCAAGFYIDGTGDPAVNGLWVRDNCFEGGGAFLKLGAVLGGKVSGNYLESNSGGDISTLKGHIYMVRASGGYTSGFEISGNTFQATTAQQTDTTWSDIQYAPGVVSTDSVKPPVITGNWSNSYQLITSSAVVTCYNNGGPGGDAVAQRMRTPSLHTTAGVSYSKTTRTFLASSYLSGAVFTVAELSTADIKALISANSTARAHTAELTIMLQSLTSAGVCVGSAVAKILLIIQGAQGGGNVDSMFVNGTLTGFVQILNGNVFDTTYSSDFKQHWTSPALTVAANGADNYYIKLSGYAAVSTANYGAADRIQSSFVLATNGSAYGNQYRGLLTLA